MTKPFQYHLLSLNPDRRIAEGVERMVFADPDAPDRLIKVIRPYDPSRYTRLRMGDVTKRLSKAAYLRPLIKEFDEYRRLMFRYGDDPVWVCPVAHVFGFRQTSLGLGTTVERIAGADDDLAPSLGHLLQSEALTDDLLQDLNAFIERLYGLGLRAGDLSADNFVHGRRTSGPTAQGAAEWVLVDGYGDRHAVPVRSLGRWSNALGLDDCFRRMSKRIPLAWNGDARQLHWP